MIGWLSSIVIAILSGALGVVVAGAVAAACVRWYRVSSFEGKSGCFVVLTALLGGAGSLVLALVATRLVPLGPPVAFLKGLGLCAALIASLGGLAALLCWSLADIPPTIDSKELDLQVEIRLPAACDDPTGSQPGDWVLWLGSVVRRRQRTSRQGEVDLTRLRRENGRWILPAAAWLFTGRGKRSLCLQRGGQVVAGFLLPLPRRPDKRFEQWSDWLPRCEGKGGPAWPDEKASCRFRVVRRNA